MLCGTIGSSSVFIASSNIGGGYSTLLGALYKSDWVLFVMFSIIFVIGVFMTIGNINK